MRLLLITQDFPPDVGGTQTYAYELAQRLYRLCEDFAVVAPWVPQADLVDSGLPFDVVRVHASYDTISFKAWLPILRLARRRRFEVAFHVQWPTAVATLLARPLGGPHHIFIAAHGRELLLQPWARVSLLNTFYHHIRSWVLRHVDGLFPVSRYTGGLLQRHHVPTERIHVLNNGTDPARFFPVHAAGLRNELGLASHKIILTVSRLVPRKGIDTVLRALPMVAETIPAVHYLVVGDGPDRERLAALAHELAISSRVCFLGKIPPADLLKYYNVCDVFTMPSRQEEPFVEGFGLVFLEANACGKPVVGARSGGIPDAVLDDETGLLVEPDDVHGLAGALIQVLKDPALASRLGSKGLKRVREKANWDHVAQTLYHTLEQAL